MVSESKRYLLLISVMTLIIAISSSDVFAAATVVNNKKYTHPAFYSASLHRLFHGVDVSVWQGDINWKKSKAAGIDFAILRCGYTALAKFTLHQDSTFVTNYTDATNAGVSVGIYYYACATTAAEAKKEANYVISILKNNNINNQLPIVMDYEINTGRCNTVYNRLVKKKGKDYARKRFTNNAKTFMNVLRASGYEAMFYSYRALIDPAVSANYRFNMSEINGSSQYRFWLAQYSTSISYTGKMEIWQFSSTGKVSGMKGNIDRNFWYYPLEGVGTTSGTKSIRNCTVKLSSSEYKYDGTIKEPNVKVKDGKKALTEGTDYSVSYMNNIQKGTATVLVHGKGAYSNETYSTFKIGNKNVGDDKTTINDEDPDNANQDSSEPVPTDQEASAQAAAPDENTPAKVTGLYVSLDPVRGRFTATWNPAENATRYQIYHKINDADKWTKTKVEGTSFEVTDVPQGSLIEILVRGQNVGEEKTTNGAWSKRQYRYMKKPMISSVVQPDKKIKTTWSGEPDNKGAVEYTVTLTDVNISSTNYTTKRNYKVINAKGRHCYDVSVTPVLTRNDHRYTGITSDRANVYVMYGKIKSVQPIKGGFKLTYKKANGIGDPRYKIIYSSNKKLKNAKITTRAQDKTTCRVKKLKSGKKYYAAMQPYKVLNGITYLGVRSDKVKTVAK